MPPLAGVQSGHMGNRRSRSVPRRETKDATCMLMHCGAFQQEDEVCRSFGESQWVVKWKQRARIDFEPSFFFFFFNN